MKLKLLIESVLKATEDVICDHTGWFIAVMVIVFSAVMALAFTATERARLRCVRDGGSWEKIGHTIYIYRVGTVISQQPMLIYGCVHHGPS